LLLLIPTQLSATAQTGAMGILLKRVNPAESALHFLEKMLVNNRTFDQMWPFIAAPVLFCGIILALMWMLSANLRLDAGLSIKARLRGPRRAIIAGGLIVAALTVFLGTLSTALAQGAPDPAGRMAADTSPGSLQIAVDLDYKVVRAGDSVLYKTLISNPGPNSSSNLTVAMNIINLDADGDVVDPEDWSPQRTQYLHPLAPGQTAELSWQVNAILNGNYMVYTVAIPAPGGENLTSQPVASSGIHLTVMKHTRLNPAGVLPYTLGGPLALLIITILLHWQRRRSVDSGGEG